MAITLGEKLRQAREARGMSIGDVAEQTKISAHYLEAIENNDFSNLPGGVFNKGFIKLYARCVGLDEQEVVQDYLHIVNQKDDEELKLYKPEVLADADSNSPKLITIAVLFILIVVAVWGGTYLITYLKSSDAFTPQPSSPSTEKEPTVNSAKAINPVNDLAQSIPMDLEVRVSVEKVSVEAIIDGKRIIKDITLNSPQTYSAQEVIRLKYYKGFANDVQLILNGKQITPPAPMQNRNVIEFEINRSNVRDILQSGQIKLEAK
ncbi:MAG: helix-turn-helix domain-containing protein [Acidobacteria bacterium]|nr:MAG: helix-turn-helix domain-containing protein [Acidobacteriota bacterium]